MLPTIPAKVIDISQNNLARALASRAALLEHEIEQRIAWLEKEATQLEAAYLPE